MTEMSMEVTGLGAVTVGINDSTTRHQLESTVSVLYRSSACLVHWSIALGVLLVRDLDLTDSVAVGFEALSMLLVDTLAIGFEFNDLTTR